MGCAGRLQARPKGAHTQSERRADGARKKRCAIPLTRSKELFQPDARSDLLLLGPGLRPGRCGRVGSPEGVGRGSRNPRPPPLAQRSARRSKLDSGRCSCFHPTTGRPHGPARPFERSFWKGNAQFSAPRRPNGPNGINDFNGFTVPYENHETNGFNEITISRYPPKSTISTKSTKSRFHGPQRNHESNETHEKNETPGKKAFRCFRCVCINRDFVGNVAGRITPVSVSGTRGGSSRKSGGTAGKSCWGCRSRSRRRSGRCCRPGGPAGRRRPA